MSSVTHGATDHEERDIPYRRLARWSGYTLVFLAVTIVSMYVVFGNPSRYIDPDLVLKRKMTQPTLQSDEVNDMKKFRQSEEEHLTTYGWVDRAHGKVHIPIDRAMDLVLQKGLPVRGAKP